MESLEEKMQISEKIQKETLKFLKSTRKADLILTYLFYVEKKFDLKPVLFIRNKTIYQSLDTLLGILEKEGKLFRETEIKIQFGKQNVNAHTKKIYICPFTGKVFGDNTHPNPQDAIYDWISKCPENKERIGGLRVKRFYVSEDPEIIKKYIKPRKASVSKLVYSSGITGKLFNSKKAIIEDFKKTSIKYFTLFEVQNQNKYEIEQNFLDFIQEQLTEDKIKAFVEAISKFKEFEKYLEKWLK